LNNEPSDTAGQLIGYARVSTSAQDLALQLDALRSVGCERIYRDVGSGSIRRRPQLEACLDYLRPGDVIVVWRLDRLGRSLRHLIDVLAGLRERQIAFRSLKENIDTRPLPDVCSSTSSERWRSSSAS
jgi:DNA invertase Pin-like site-specific DNA recombinase